MKGMWTFDVMYDFLDDLGLEKTIDNLLEGLRNETGHEGEWLLESEQGPGGGWPSVVFIGERDTIRKWYRDVYTDGAFADDEVDAELDAHFKCEL